MLYDCTMSFFTLARSAPRRSSVLGLVGWVALCFVAPALGGLAMPDAWYASLHKPLWNPPGWLFGPVWALLYTMMAVAAWQIWRRGGWAGQRGPLVLFLVQLALNAAWTPLFFRLHQPGWALLDMVLLWLAIIVTILAFLRVNRGAAWLLLPYLMWVSFAAVLNLTLWRMNV